ncbi:TolC family protein [Leptothrix ochracea]|uniref:TolC family protein n=1 Tax=Leptothrix ochracea TaxID=735331 RepID=UPI0034E26888
MNVHRPRYPLKTLLITALLSAWCMGVRAGDTPPLNPPIAPSASALGAQVDELLRFARERNPDALSLQQEALTASARVESAGALPDPRLRTELMDVTQGGQQSPSVSPSRVGSTRYTLMQDVPWFGKRDLRRDIAEQDAKSAHSRAQGTWSEVAAKIKTTYAQQYVLAKNESLTREILALLARLEKLAQTRYASGLAGQQDVIRAQVEQSLMQGELIGVETERHHMHARMNALLGRPSNAALAEPQGLRPLPSNEQLDQTRLEERIQAHNPQLLTEDARLQGAEKSRELAYKNRYPDVTFGIVPNQVQNSIKQWDLMIELNIPLQQSSRRSQESEAEAMLTVARTRREATRNQVSAELAENIAGLDAARRLEALAAQSLLPQAELSFKSALAGYENGKGDFASLLDAQRQIRQARQSQIKAQAEAQARLADIERILGEDL